jgi:hypothetical protein
MTYGHYFPLYLERRIPRALDMVLASAAHTGRRVKRGALARSLFLIVHLDVYKRNKIACMLDAARKIH